MEVSVNYLAIILAALASRVVGYSWYSPSILGKVWQQFIKLPAKSIKKDTLADNIKAFSLAIISAYVLYYFVAMFNHYFTTSWLSASLNTSFLIWVGFVLTTHLTKDIFEKRDIRFSGITIGHHLFEFMAMGLAIGLMGI